MKVYQLPRIIKALIFDMDLTLYSNREYGQYQIDSIVAKLGETRGLSFDAMNREVEELRNAWPVSHGGKVPSLSNLLSAFGIGMEENIRWRDEIYEPGRFIGKDERLAKVLGVLSGSYILGVVTNNPALVARKTLAALGVDSFFPFLVALDTCMIPKPHKVPFLKFTGLSRCLPETCVSIGDRFDIDLDIPLSLGMGGILVDGVEDVYRLPEILGTRGDVQAGNFR